LIVTFCPATTTMPLRAAPAFSPIDSATAPDAFALAPFVTRIHGV